jgi:hypothetical protein
MRLENFRRGRSKGLWPSIKSWCQPAMAKVDITMSFLVDACHEQVEAAHLRVGARVVSLLRQTRGGPIIKRRRASGRSQPPVPIFCA